MRAGRGRRRICKRQGRPLRAEDGFTLVELLIVLLIGPLILGAVAFAVITSINNDVGVSTRLTDSHDAQITAAVFVRDVQSASKVAGELSTPLCGGGTQILGLEWNPTPGTTDFVSYSVGSSVSPPPSPPVVPQPWYALYRNFCSSAATTVSTVSHDIVGTGSVAVSFVCSAAYPNCSADASNLPISSVEVATVHVQVSERSGYQYGLTAAPRQAVASTGALPPGSVPPALLLLGSGPGVLACGGSGSSPFGVNGLAAVNSPSVGSITMAGNDTVTAGQFYTQDSGSGPSGPVQPASGYTSTTAQPYSSGPAFPDPYSSLPDPSTSGLTKYTTTSSLPGPGIYQNLVTITGNVSITTGVYIFESGLTVEGPPGATITGSGVLFFIGTPNASPSMPQTAAYTVMGNGSVNISPMTTGTYSGVVIFQSRTDSNALQVAGNGASSTYGGVIYAPGANVSTFGNGGTAGSGIIAKSLSCGGNGGVLLGSSTLVSTSTSVSSSNPDPQSGQAVTFTATVAGADGLSPSGSVMFAETPNGSTTPTTMCTAVSMANGQATCTTSSLGGAASPYTITANYLGNSMFASSTGTMSQPVQPPTATSTTVTAAPASPVTNQAVTLKATVSPTPDAGTVTWSITYGTNNSVSCTASALSGGVATCTIAAGLLQAANSPYTVKATYSGDVGFGASSGTLTLTVGKASSTTTAVLSPKNLKVNSAVTDTATVTGGTVPITGSVTFYICPGATTGCSSSGTSLGMVALSGGNAARSFTPTTKGNYCFAAYYSGDANYNASSDTTTDQCFSV